MKSFYELTKEDASTLEVEFLKLEQGRHAHKIWVLNNIMGILLSSTSIIVLVLQIMIHSNNLLLFVLFCLFLVFGLFVVYSGTIEYHKKLNSWLRVSKKVVKD